MKEEANISERMDNCQQRGKKKGKARRAEDAPNRTLGARLTTRPERKPTKFFFFPLSLRHSPSKATYRPIATLVSHVCAAVQGRQIRSSSIWSHMDCAPFLNSNTFS